MFFNCDFVSPLSDRPSHYLSGNNEEPTWFWKFSRRGCGNLTGMVGQSCASFFMQRAGCRSRGIDGALFSSSSGDECLQQKLLQSRRTVKQQSLSQPLIPSGATAAKVTFQRGAGAAAALWETGNCCWWGCGAGRNKLMSPAVL